MPNTERTTPENITKLAHNEVFVFGSNLAGRHGKGAALIAKKFGAITGRGEGRMGRCYAIPTKDVWLKVIPLDDIAFDVGRFCQYADLHSGEAFLVTALGTGLSGYKPADIAPMFRDAPDNVVLPASFLAVLST